MGYTGLPRLFSEEQFYGSETEFTMSHRIFNFSAGPAILPEPVLAEAAEGVREINGSGMSILEVSHRGKDYEAIHMDAETRLLRVLGLDPTEYAALFMAGGASQQFAQVPQNFLKPGVPADYVVSGDWGAKALSEAKHYGDAREAASSKAEKYAEIPKSFTQTAGARYVHITTNNTIEGTEYFALPDVGDTPLVADMSSDYLALRRDYSKFALMYGGAQKNIGPAGVTVVVARKSFVEGGNTDLPKIYSYRTFLESRSLYNTPPAFPVYVVGLVLKWIESEGGLEAIEARNRHKAALLYNTLDALTPFFQPSVTEKADRSLMNVTWRLRDESLEPDLLAEFKKAGMQNLKGHRSVGGFRASIYNAFPEDGVRALCDLLRDFVKRKG